MSSRIKLLLALLITAGVFAALVVIYKFHPGLVSRILSFTIESRKDNAIVASALASLLFFMLWRRTGSENDKVHIFFSVCIGICFILMLLAVWLM